jgi:hypothetical protein
MLTTRIQSARSEHAASQSQSLRTRRSSSRGLEGEWRRARYLLVLGSDLVVAELLHQLRPGYHRSHPSRRRRPRRRRLRHHRRLLSSASGGASPAASRPFWISEAAGFGGAGGSARFGGLGWNWIPPRRGVGDGGKSRPGDDEATRGTESRKQISASSIW